MSDSRNPVPDYSSHGLWSSSSLKSILGFATCWYVSRGSPGSLVLFPAHQAIVLTWCSVGQAHQFSRIAPSCLHRARASTCRGQFRGPRRKINLEHLKNWKPILKNWKPSWKIGNHLEKLEDHLEKFEYLYLTKVIRAILNNLMIT